jgi:hypothetical protein
VPTRDPGGESGLAGGTGVQDPGEPGGRHSAAAVRDSGTLTVKDEGTSPDAMGCGGGGLGYPRPGGGVGVARAQTCSPTQTNQDRSSPTSSRRRRSTRRSRTRSTALASSGSRRSNVSVLDAQPAPIYPQLQAWNADQTLILLATGDLLRVERVLQGLRSAVRTSDGPRSS